MKFIHYFIILNMDQKSENIICSVAAVPSANMETFESDKSSYNVKAQKQENSFRQNYKNEEKLILLEDSTLQKVPNYVENLLNVFMEAQQRNEAELLLALIYCIALESGFAVEDCLDENCNENIHSSFFYGSTFNKKFTEIYSNKFPKIFQDETNVNFYKFQLTLVNYSQYKCFLVAIRTGEYFVITLTNNYGPGRSWCLSIPRYVLSRRSNNLPSLFRNLPELSMLMKDHIFGPVRNYILADLNNLFPGLTGLPVELSHCILGNLDRADLQNLSKTCWKLRCICVDYYELKDKPVNKPFGSKRTILSDTSSPLSFRNFY